MTGHTMHRDGDTSHRRSFAPLVDENRKNVESPAATDISLTGRHSASRTDAERCRRAAMLARMAARELASARSVTDRTDGAADLARLREIAASLDGYAESREEAA